MFVVALLSSDNTCDTALEINQKFAKMLRFVTLKVSRMIDEVFVLPEVDPDVVGDPLCLDDLEVLD